MEKRLSFRPNERIITLLTEIEEFLGPVSRTEIFQMAVNTVIEENNVDWKKAAKKVKVKEAVDTQNFPDLMQFKIDSERLDILYDQIKLTFAPLKRVTTPYLIQLLFSNLLNVLQENSNSYVKNSEDGIDLQERLEINRKIANLLLENSEEAIKKLFEIKAILDV